MTTDHRALGFWTALALVVGNLIGSGIYLLPATLAPLGPNALAGWGVTIAGGMCLAFVFARLAHKLPLPGGPYAYAQAAFGRLAGFAVAWSYWVMLWAGNGAVAVAVVSALSLVIPELRVPWLGGLAALALSWSLIAVNIRGVALAGRVQLVTTLLKLVPLAGVVLVAVGILAARGGEAIEPLAPAPLTLGGVAAAAALTFWGFLGLESATVPADKVRNAARTVPLVTLLGTALAGLVYFLVATSIALLMPAEVAAASPAPIAEFLGGALGPWIGGAVALFAAISAFGALNGFTLLTGEMPWAMAKGGVFPRWFAAESARGTPARSLLVSGVLMSMVMLLNYSGSTGGQLFSDVATISLAAGMLAYLAVPLAAVRLFPRDLPLVAMSIVSALFVLWMVWGLGTRACLWGLGLIALGLPVYFWVRSSRA